jgi:hypothetical protein
MSRFTAWSWLRFSGLFGAAFILGAFVWSAPAPKDKPKEADDAVEPMKATEEEAARYLKNSQDNLKQIALAFHNFHDANNKWPKDVENEKGKALLSWRVQVLPYLEQAELYNQFKLDEPWDSANNRPLVEKMPEIFSSPRVKVKTKGFTVYQGFAGVGALFEPGKMLRIADITDGTSNTIMVVESSKGVPWTKPADLTFNEKKDLPDFGKAYGGKPLAALCDGSVRVLDLKTITPKTLKAAITVNGGEIMGPDW